MKNCSLVFNTNIEKKDSILYKDLLSNYKSEERADYIYDKIIMSDIYQKNSFLQWLDDKVTFDVTSQGEPHIEEFLEWVKFLAKESSLRKTFSTNAVNTTVEEFISLSEGITSFIPEVLKKKGLTFNDLFEGFVNSENIFNNSLNSMLEMLQENANEEEDVEFRERAQLIIDEIKNNPKIFLDAYNTYLDATLRITFTNNENSMENESLDENIQESVEEEEKQTKDTAFNKSDNEFSSKDNAPKAIKLMVASLTDPSDLNSLGLPKLVDYNKVMNLLHDELSNVPGYVDLYLTKMTASQNRIPALEQLVDQLNFYKGTFTYSKDKDQMFREQRLRTQFVNHFNKTKYGYTLHIKNAEGDYQVIDSNLDKSKNVKLAEWESRFKQQVAENPKFYTEENFKNRIKKMNKFQLLPTLGIRSIEPGALPDSIISDIEKYGMTSFENFLNIYDRKNKSDVRSKLLKLAEIEVRNDANIIELQHYNAEGKLVYGISLNSYLSDRVKGLAYYAGNEFELKSRFPELYGDPFIGSSTFASWIKAGKKIKIGISTGLKNENKGKSVETANLNRRDITIQKMYSLLQEGEYNFMRAADRKIENTFSFQDELGREVNGREGLIVDGKTDAAMYLINHLYDEIQTNMYYDLGMDIQNLKDFDVNTTRVFTLKDGTNLIKKVGFDKLSSMSADEMMDNKQVTDFVMQKLDEIIKTEADYIKKQSINSSDLTSLVKEYGNMDNVIEQFAINGYLSNLEIAKIFTGDPLIYGKTSNFFKRMSMLNSTKEATRTDNEMNEFIATLTNNMETKMGFTDGRTGSNISTITLADIESDMSTYSQEEVDTLKEILGTTKGYNGINEADGFAYVTYDEYRIMKMRYADWDVIDEELYQKITSDENYVIEERDFNRIRPDKSQYVGKLGNQGLEDFNVVGGRKFAFMPLIPGLIKEGSVLDKLNNEMLRNGVGMAFMESAAKFGNKAGEDNKPVHKLYDEFGNFGVNISEDSLDIIDYSQIGNQLKIDKKEKRQQTESTQKRKLNLSNFHENGKMIDSLDPNLPLLLNEYDEIQRERIDRAYKTLTTRMGFNEESQSDKLMEFVNSLTNMGKLQGFTTNELLALEELMTLPFLDILPNKQRIENFLMAKLKNKAITQKRKGSSMAQASNVGFELPGGKSRHDLKFYRLSKPDENGKKRLLPMEVYSPLPKELMSYVSEVYNNGKGLTIKALEEFNKDIAEDNAIYEETGKMTSLTKLTMFVGFRIPNQGASSSDVGKVKSFYPPHVGTMVVVPKAMVIKTGSDFDIDKLNMYLPDIEVTKDINDKVADKFFDKYMSRALVTKALKDIEVGFDYKEQSYETLKKWFADSILKVDRQEVTYPRYKMYNELYKSMLKGESGPLQLKYISSKKSISEMNDRELNNKALENEIAITLSEDNWKQLLTPLDSTNIKDIVKLIRGFANYKEETNLSDIFLASMNTDKMVEFLSGKAGVGQVAVHNTNHVLAQKAGLGMEMYHNYFGDYSPFSEEETVVTKREVSVNLTDLVKKPEIEMNFMTDKEILNMVSPMEVKLKHDALMERKKELENIINCLWT